MTSHLLYHWPPAKKLLLSFLLIHLELALQIFGTICCLGHNNLSHWRSGKHPNAFPERRSDSWVTISSDNRQRQWSLPISRDHLRTCKESIFLDCFSDSSHREDIVDHCRLYSWRGCRWPKTISLMQNPIEQTRIAFRFLLQTLSATGRQPGGNVTNGHPLSSIRCWNRPDVRLRCNSCTATACSHRFLLKAEAFVSSADLQCWPSGWPSG